MVLVTNYFVIQKKLLGLSGLSFNEGESILYKIYSLIVCSFLIIYLILLAFDTIANLDDFDVLIDSLYHGVAIAAVLTKFFLVLINGRKLNQMLNMLEIGVFAPNPKRGGSLEEILIAQCVTNTNRLVVISWTLGFSTLIISIVFTMAKRISSSDSLQWQLPFGKFSTLHPRKSPNYELAWLFQSLMFPMAVLIYVAADFLVVGVLSHIALQLKMLRNSIKRMVMNAKEDEEVGGTLYEYLPTLDWEALKVKLRENVLYYISILDLAEQFEEILNVLVFSNYLAISITLACMMYHGSLYSPSDPRFQKDATMLMGVMYQIFLISYFGHQVTLESELVLFACYEVNFVGTDIRFQKGLCITMSRSQEPVKFTIGKFAHLSLISFVTVVRASVSYYMVLHSMNATA